MANWQHRRTIEADRNLYDRYADPVNGSAVIYARGRTLFGYANGVPFEVEYPDLTAITGSRGNVQAARLRPESGQWWLYVYCDGPDGVRTEMQIAVALL